jgi:hypothetical protein
MASIHRRLRPCRQAGLYRGRTTGTEPPPTPTQQRSIATLRDQLVADHLHDDPTAGQSVILDLLTFAKVRHADATSYLAQMPRPWIDRRAHRAWRIVRKQRRAANGYSTLIVPFRPSASRGDLGSRPSRLVTKAYRPGVSEQAVAYRPGGTVTVRR